MNIRDSVLEDAERIAVLIDSVSRERLFLAGTEGFSADDTRAFIASIRASGSVQVVAENSGEIVGWCDIARFPFEGMRHVGRLGMGVHRNHRSQGIGRGLLREAIERAHAAGVERIELEVFASNRAAVGLYESFGFESEGCKIAGWRLDGRTDDILIYARRHLKAS